jgi:molecular chaperone GrpE (heat shock protein)
MWRKLKNLVIRPKNAEPDPWKSALPEISEDAKEIKKLIRRQGLSLELFKKELIGKIDETRPPEPDDLWDLADSFFYLSKSLGRLPDLSESHLQAMDLVWQRLDILLGRDRMEMIRSEGVLYDPRLHESVAPLPEYGGSPTVKEILMPGRSHQGKIVKAAKVSLESNPE